jgi:hypothetical protein
MDPDENPQLLDDVITRLGSIELELANLSADIGQVRTQGVELQKEIEAVKRAVEEIDPIL